MHQKVLEETKTQLEMKRSLLDMLNGNTPLDKIATPLGSLGRTV
jgi:hypothetical protein